MVSRTLESLNALVQVLNVAYLHMPGRFYVCAVVLEVHATLGVQRKALLVSRRLVICFCSYYYTRSASWSLLTCCAILVELVLPVALQPLSIMVDKINAEN